MSETRLRPQPDELWRTYAMTPFGPGAISSLVRVVDVAPNRQVGQDIVRYQGVHPVETDQTNWLPLDRFVTRHAAPYESEEDWWMRRRGAGPVSERQASWDDAIGRAVAALKADDMDYSFRCECGFSTRDSRYEAHVCPESAGPVRPDEEPTP